HGDRAHRRLRRLRGTASDRGARGRGPRGAVEGLRRRLHVSIGSPAAFQARMPPAKCASYFRPAACAACEAVTERRPERQANTTCLPLGSGIFLKSKLCNGTITA